MEGVGCLDKLLTRSPSTSGGGGCGAGAGAEAKGVSSASSKSPKSSPSSANSSKSSPKSSSGSLSSAPSSSPSPSSRVRDCCTPSSPPSHILLNHSCRPSVSTESASLALRGGQLTIILAQTTTPDSPTLKRLARLLRRFADLVWNRIRHAHLLRLRTLYLTIARLIIHLLHDSLGHRAAAGCLGSAARAQTARRATSSLR